jgi:hypothetical protein
VFTELPTPCRDFMLVAFRFHGRVLFEAVRVAGEGTLYSVATADPEELRSVVAAACRDGGCGL